MKKAPDTSILTPFLRWAGGKTWLVNHLKNILINKKFNNYHEPFLGGAAIFLALNNINRSFLSDLNKELINTYITIRDDPLSVIKTLKTYKNTKDFYYELRSKEFNDAINQTARFIFLNQTSYNGLYRVNLQGIYNVPYGFRSKDFLEENKLLEISLKLKNATINAGDFTCNKQYIQEGDLVFLDPPYTMSHNNNGFIKYNQKLFSIDDQKRLSNYIDYIKSMKAYYVLTNAASEIIFDIFNKNDLCIELSRASTIGGKFANRGKISEYIFTNIS